MKRMLLAMIAIGAGLGTIGGCQSNPSTVTLEQAVGHYQAGRYSLARQDALELRRTAGGEARSHAAYLAGLSAYQLGRHDEARTDLVMAAASTDADTAGRAGAQLGLIELELHQPIAAARYFEVAAGKLSGAEARRAAHHAALAHDIAGDYTRADQWNQRSTTTLAMPDYSTSGTVDSVRSSYVLQAGAFQNRARAERTAEGLEPLALTHQMGPVRVVRGPVNRGRELHMVQFGAFHDLAEANRARASLGRLELIVVPAN